MFSRRAGARFNRGRVPEPGPAITATEERAIDLSILLGAVVDRIDRDRDGDLIKLVAPAWRAILALLEEDPDVLFKIDPRKLEELIAAKYDAEGGYRVILTPRSGDFGRDVVAESVDGPRVRIFDQVKAYGKGHRVPATDVRALMGVVAHSDATKGVVTTTSEFAPMIERDPYIQDAVAKGLELVNGDDLLRRLRALKA